jgi:hypothetical protein
MASVAIEDQTITLRFSALEKLGGLRRGASAALSDITSVEVCTDPWSALRGLRVGTGIPFVIVLGTMLRSGKNDVVAVYGRKPIVLVEFGPGAPHERWLWTEAEPAQVVEKIQAALSKA